MNAKMKRLRKELAEAQSLKAWPVKDEDSEGLFVTDQYYPNELRYYSKQAFLQGFDAAHDLLMKDVSELLEALEQYSAGDLTPAATDALTKWYSKYGDEK